MLEAVLGDVRDLARGREGGGTAARGSEMQGRIRSEGNAKPWMASRSYVGR